MIELTQEHRDRWETELRCDPDVLERVMTAFRMLLLGDRRGYHHHLGMARTQHAFGRTFEGYGESYSVAVAGCVWAVARRWEVTEHECLLRLDALQRGEIDPPVHLFHDQEVR